MTAWGQVTICGHCVTLSVRNRIFTSTRLKTHPSAVDEQSPLAVKLLAGKVNENQEIGNQECSASLDSANRPDRRSSTLFVKLMASVEDAIGWFGGLCVFAGHVAHESFRRPFEFIETLKQIFEIGWRSAPLIILSGLAVGSVLSMHTRSTLERFGAESMIPTALAFALVKETGPLVTGLLVSGRVGAGIGAELGGMRVTEQIDALESLAVNSFNYLVLTRVVACVVSMPLLTVLMNFAGLMGGFFAETMISGTSFAFYFNTAFSNLTFSDYIPPTLKTMVFGFIIGSTSAYLGYNANGGAEGVGRASTQSVVLSSIFLIVFNVILVKFIFFLYPGAAHERRFSERRKERQSMRFGSKPCRSPSAHAPFEGHFFLSSRKYCVRPVGAERHGQECDPQIDLWPAESRSGAVIVDGEDITKLDSNELAATRKHMGFLFQSAALFDSISVGENVAFPLRRHTERPNAEIRAQVRKPSRESGLGKEYDTMPGDLSGGMRKRAGLARALADRAVDPPCR